jgi:glycosyltransferase involved in cell wall biosynthesis
MKPEVSIVVPALNEEKMIGKCLEALCNQSVDRDRYEIIVSDSYSVDKTVEIAEQYADKIVEEHSKGAGAARNFGVRHAKAEKIGFIDADSIAGPRWVEGIIESLDQGIASTGPIESIEKDSKGAEIFYKWWSFQSRLTIKLGFPIFPGFNIGVRKNEFWLAGGFGEHDYTCEDIDVGLKLRKLGRIIFNKKMVVRTSNRRVKSGGYISYILNAWNFVLFRKSRTWAEHRGPDKRRIE